MVGGSIGRRRGRIWLYEQVSASTQVASGRSDAGLGMRSGGRKHDLSARIATNPW